MAQKLLEINGLTKAYPGVIANDDVSFNIDKGEIHALLGENGAGKSTLVKMIYGLVRPNSGQMSLLGNDFAPSEPRAARLAGIAMVFQHFSLFEALDVAENIALGMENPPKQRELAARISKVSRDYGLPLDPHRLVGDLSAGERQRVEIIRCLLQDPKLLIMDEPTSVLIPQEVKILFKTLRQLAKEGTAILYISHKLEEIRTICDHATILRAGKVVATCTPQQKSARALAEMMVGSSLHEPLRQATEFGDVVLKIDNLNAPSRSQFGTALKNINMNVRAGEILGIGGVAGNGQEELLAAISGETTGKARTTRFNGIPIGNIGPNARRKMGVLAAPEERLGHAAAPDMSLTENTLLTAAPRKNLVKNGFVDWEKTRKYADEIIAKFDVRTPGAGTAARALSGGNLQKFVIGREVLQDPRVLIVNQPTWGVDASAAVQIRQSLLDLAAKGTAIVVISQDLDELMEISDNFCALNAGILTPPRPAKDLSVEEIGLMLGGGHGAEVANV